ncbi:MAG TPA: hypothetical protein DCX89_06405 [Saprospirales bacterium]|nr:hypothetical protein [Saprospirales bacterium]
MIYKFNDLLSVHHVWFNFMKCISTQSLADKHPVETSAKVGFLVDFSLSEYKPKTQIIKYPPNSF